VARKKSGEKQLYRRKWTETSNPLVAEARAQTLAIQRLQIWLRLGYAVLAIAVLMGYYGFSNEGFLPLGIVGVVLGILSFVVVAVLRVGIGNGRKNVNAMLEELQASVPQTGSST
jgi:hypothetical protein